MSLIDLTSLGGSETRGRDRAPVRARGAPWHGRHLHLCRACRSPARALDGSAVRLATVANFPHGGDDIAAAAEETAAAVAAGADEVDVVAPIAAILDGDIGLVGELVEACRAAAGPRHHAEADPGDRQPAGARP